MLFLTHPPLEQKRLSANMTVMRVFRETRRRRRKTAPAVAGPQHHKCDVCGKEFANREYLRRHSELHSTVKRYECHACDKAYHLRSSIETHVLLHIDGCESECSVCGYRTKYRKYMKRHMEGHADVRSWVCHVCGKRFAKQETLQKHSKRHDDSRRRFPCTQCNKVLCDAKSFTDHMHRHNGQLDFACDLCACAYVTFALLRRHRFLKHQVSEYRCLVCSQTFDKMMQLKKHHQQAHYKVTQPPSA
jgi:uncharacterized Zn-finger protein